LPKINCWPLDGNAHAPNPAKMLKPVSMSPTVEECLEHAGQFEWYAARTNYEEDRRFLLWRAEQWAKRARELKASGLTLCLLAGALGFHNEPWWRPASSHHLWPFSSIHDSIIRTQTANARSQRQGLTRLMVRDAPCLNLYPVLFCETATRAGKPEPRVSKALAGGFHDGRATDTG
jgi:hypothetical protein